MVAHSEIHPFDTNLYIDWAIEMMELGFETPSLLMLSSFSKSQKYYTSYFEMISYLNDSIQELGLELKTKEDAVLSFSSYFIKQIAKGYSVKKNLKEVFQAYQSDFYEALSDFGSLYWAWQDIDDEVDFHYYWQGVNSSNIEATIVNIAQEWIKKYEKQYKIQLKNEQQH